jgi:hypothetical protein
MIYVKTAAGRQALIERSEAMPRKYHFPFLMIDGVRDSTVILSASASHGFTSVDLHEMVQAGFIVPRASETVVPSSAITSSQSTSNNPEQFAKLKRNASRLLEDLLGPDAERLCLQIEECKNRQSFDVAINKMVDVLTQMRNASIAANYQKSVLAL